MLATCAMQPCNQINARLSSLPALPGRVHGQNQQYDRTSPGLPAGAPGRDHPRHRPAHPAGARARLCGRCGASMPTCRSSAHVGSAWLRVQLTRQHCAAAPSRSLCVHTKGLLLLARLCTTPLLPAQPSSLQPPFCASFFRTHRCTPAARRPSCGRIRCIPWPRLLVQARLPCRPTCAVLRLHGRLALRLRCATSKSCRLPAYMQPAGAGSAPPFFSHGCIQSSNHPRPTTCPCLRRFDFPCDGSVSQPDSCGLDGGPQQNAARCSAGEDCQVMMWFPDGRDYPGAGGALVHALLGRNS